jgi:pantoate--beta-alanine ligase
MQIIKTKKELRSVLKQMRFANGKKTGFVPTMGFLHKGHVSLIEESKIENDITVVSIFVNPAQFNDATDFTAYPENLKGDAEICENAGVDILFVPHKNEFFPESADSMDGHKPKTGRDLQADIIQLAIPALTESLCGPGRPGHFEGVILIVARLFNIIQPDTAYFGKKDYQQFRIISKMTEDLDFPVNVKGMPTYREESGLAMSSRNSRLSEKGKDQATLINRAILLGKKAADEGKSRTSLLCEIMKDVIETGSLNSVEYIEIVKADTLQPIEDLDSLQEGESYVTACAVLCEGVRLIDNMEFIV